MAPKGKASDKGGATKGKGKGKADAEEKGGKVKGAQQINVRHILCEKHSKKEEALEKLKGGAKFDEVAKEFSEDKARAGRFIGQLRRGMLLICFSRWVIGLEDEG